MGVCGGEALISLPPEALIGLPPEALKGLPPRPPPEGSGYIWIQDLVMFLGV